MEVGGLHDIGRPRLSWKEGTEEHVYLTIRQYRIHIYKNRIVRRVSLRLNKASSATAAGGVML